MMKRIVLLAALSVLGAAPSSAAAQNGQRPPKCDTPKHRQFDFWIGEWTVTDSAGTTPMGRSSITLEEQGCLIHEHWFGGAPNGGQGGTGQSLNAYDRRTDQWGQYWVDFSGTVLLLKGGIVNGSMVLQGEVPAPNGSTSLSRISWTPMPDGRVRQVWSTSTDGGKSWQVAFDGWYKKKS